MDEREDISLGIDEAISDEDERAGVITIVWEIERLIDCVKKAGATSAVVLLQEANGAFDILTVGWK